MPTVSIEYEFKGCLPSCLPGELELQKDEQVKFDLLPPLDALWPASILTTVSKVERTNKGRIYTLEYDMSLLNGASNIPKDCNLSVPEPYCCCDEIKDTTLVERLSPTTTRHFNFDGSFEDVEAGVPIPDTDTTYTYEGNGIFMSSSGDVLDASDLLDDTDTDTNTDEVIDTSATYDVVDGVLVVPTVDIDGNPTGNNLTVTIPDKFGTNIENGNGTNSHTDGNGLTVCNVACPPEGTPAGSVPITDAEGNVTWGLNHADFQISLDRVGDDLFFEIETNVAGTINGSSSFDTLIEDVFVDNDSQDISAFSGAVSNGTVTLEHTAGGVTTPVQFPLGVSSLTTVSNPDGSTTITYVDGAGDTVVAGVIPADDDSGNITQVTNADGSVTSTHEPSGLSWTTQPLDVDPDETRTSDFAGSVNGVVARDDEPVIYTEAGYNSASYEGGVAAGEDTRIGTDYEVSGNIRTARTTIENPRGKTIRVNPLSGQDSRAYSISGRAFTASVYDYLRPYATWVAAYAASADGDTIVLEGGSAWTESIVFNRSISTNVDANKITTVPSINIDQGADNPNNKLKITGRPDVINTESRVSALAVRNAVTLDFDLGEVYVSNGNGLALVPSGEVKGRISTGNITAVGSESQTEFAFGMLARDTGLLKNLVIEVEGNFTAISRRGSVIQLDGNAGTFDDSPIADAITDSPISLSPFINNALTVRVAGNLVQNDTTDTNDAFGSPLGILCAFSHANIHVGGYIYSTSRAVGGGGGGKLNLVAEQGIIGGRKMIEANGTYRGVVDSDSARFFIETPMVLMENSTNVAIGGSAGGSCVRTNNGGHVQFKGHVHLLSELLGPDGGDDSNSIIKMSGSSVPAGETNQIVFWDGVTAYSRDFEVNGSANFATFVEDNSSNISVSDFIWIYGEGDTNVDTPQFAAGGGVNFAKNGLTLGLVTPPSPNSTNVANVSGTLILDNPENLDH